MKTLLLVPFCLLCLGGAAGADQAAPDLKARNQAILSRTPGTDGIFTLLERGDIRHLQSGLVCPAGFPNVTFWDAQIYPSPLGKGADVGCDYARPDGAGHAASKLTIFVTKAAADTTLDLAFARYRKEVETAAPNAAFIGPALNIKDNPGKGGEPFVPTDFRSAEYDIVLSGVHYRSQLIVAVQFGWVIEVRATYSTVISGATDGAVAEAAKGAAGDVISPAFAFQQATRSLAAAHAGAAKPQ